MPTHASLDVRLITRLGGVAHNGFSTAMMLVTTWEYEDQEHENTFFGTIRLEMQNKCH